MEKKKELTLEELKKQNDEYLAGWQRARADFLNYKKEEKQRVEDLLVFVAQSFLLNTLSILDNFDLIEKKLPDNLKEDEYVKGLLQIKNQILDFLKKQKVEAMEVVGKKFDPNFHEAIEQVKEGESGIILEEVQKGYTISSRVLRPAKVKVNK